MMCKLYDFLLAVFFIFLFSGMLERKSVISIRKICEFDRANPMI